MTFLSTLTFYSSANILIFVNTQTHKTIPLFMQPKDTIQTVKLRILETEHIPIDDQIMIYADKQLEDGRSLSYYNIQENATLHLFVRRAHGGMYILVNSFVLI